ncbi:MAG: hypothetical protein ACRCZF_05550, partial [Gemmataceae bacterium]
SAEPVKINPQVLAALANMKALRIVWFGSNCLEFSDDAIAKLHSAQQLYAINFHESKLSETGWKQLVKSQSYARPC